jgi:predicted transcriptional regulator
MDQQAIANTLLKDLYEAWASGEWGITLDQLSEKSIWEKIDFSQAVMDLSDKDYIKKLTLDGYYRITTEGVIFVESEGICNQETSQRINSIRCQILNALAEARNQRGSFTEATFDSLVAASDAEAQIVENTLQMLREIKHVTESKSGSYKITQVGNDEIQK